MARQTVPSGGSARTVARAPERRAAMGQVDSLAVTAMGKRNHCCY